MSDNFTFKQKLVSMQSNLLNFACRLTSDRETAQDLVQDTTLKVLSNESKYVDNVNFKGWVFTIMRNIFINNYRRQTRAATVVDSTEGLYHLNLSQESGLATPRGIIRRQRNYECDQPLHRGISRTFHDVSRRL